MAGSSVISRLKGSEFRIDRICRRFEQAWWQDRPVSIEYCLLEAELVEEPRLLEELIAAEWELRIRAMKCQLWATISTAFQNTRI